MFSIKEFSRGAKQSACIVSQLLAEGQLDELKDLLSSECLTAVRNGLSLFSLPQRSSLAVSEEDIYFSYVYQIGIMMEDHPTEENKHIRHVECTWVGHSFPDYYQAVEQFKGDPIKIKRHLEECGGPMIMNYRFIRDYTKGVEDAWTINAVNHFKFFS